MQCNVLVQSLLSVLFCAAVYLLEKSESNKCSLGF